MNKTILVSFDLDKQAEISLHLSIDGGKTYTELHKLSGDVGKNVAEGHKTIVWDVLAERESLVGDYFMFKIKAQIPEQTQKEPQVPSNRQIQDILTFTINDITFKMIYVSGGTFTMGCSYKQGNECDDNEKPSHTVMVNDFYIGETEVTQVLWQAVMNTSIFDQRNKANPKWNIQGYNPNYPMYYVNYAEAKECCNKLNKILSDQLPTGFYFSLPTEAQWEYAARGGNKSRGYKYSGSDNIEDVAWFEKNSYWTTHRVKSKKANELGIYDMSGNVWEWCADWFEVYSSTPQNNPTGPSYGSDRVYRGGSWCNFFTGYCRTTNRGFNDPNTRGSDLGFRLALMRK